MKRLPLLVASDPPDAFPTVEDAFEDPPGLLAAGGDLSLERLLAAYTRGIFPWYEDGQPILWWSPDPRAVLFPSELHISRSLKKTLRRGDFEITLDQAFSQVIAACALDRPGQQGTWITDAMANAYIELHRAGFAHSAETWLGDELVGGVYGIAIGRVFFGESMFSTVTDASKAAFIQLVEQLQRWSFELVDCQIESAHLNSLGSRPISRLEFTKLLEHSCSQVGKTGKWQFD